MRTQITESGGLGLDKWAALLGWLQREAGELGHGIYGFEIFYKMGFSSEQLAELPSMQINRGGEEDHDYRVWDAQGREVASLVGIHGLDFANWLARKLHIPSPNDNEDDQVPAYSHQAKEFAGNLRKFLIEPEGALAFFRLTEGGANE
jgi:hypothetical protein